MRFTAAALTLALLAPLQLVEVARAQGASDERRAAEAAADTGTVARAQFTSLVTDREPVDHLTATSTDIDKLYFFTEFIGMAGRTVTHRWLYFDEVAAEIPFEIGGPRWRVFSYKTLQASLAGEWSVALVDERGLTMDVFSILVASSIGASAANAVASTAGASTAPPVEADARASSTIPARLQDATTEGSASPGESVAAAGDASALSVGPTASASIASDVGVASRMRRIRAMFPDARYVLVNDTLSGDDCPSGGFFSWRKTGHGLWSMDMSGKRYIRVRESAGDTGELRPDPDYRADRSDCLTYSGHNFDEARRELVSEFQLDCEGSTRDTFSASSLTRRDDIVDLTLFGDELVVCRYRTDR